MTTKSKKGFTIIEVVLVLAIAGLIFLMVFIALPALQRSQRNTQRADDLSRVLTAVNAYQSNNNGKTPFKTVGDNDASSGNYIAGVDKNFVNRYIDDKCTGAASKTEGTGDSTVSSLGFDECSDQFTDPDGKTYMMKYEGAVTANSTTAAGSTMDHVFHVYSNATCGDEGIANKGTGDRQVAIFYFMEGGSVSCNDNH